MYLPVVELHPESSSNVLANSNPIICMFIQGVCFLNTIIYPSHFFKGIDLLCWSLGIIYRQRLTLQVYEKDIFCFDGLAVNLL